METTKGQGDIKSEIRQLEEHISKDQPNLEEQEKKKKEYAEAVENYQEKLTQNKKLKKTMRVG